MKITPVTEELVRQVRKLSSAGRRNFEIACYLNVPESVVVRALNNSVTPTEHCAWCGKEFLKMTRHTRFCSDSCRYSSNRAVYNANRTEGKDVLKCIKCGIPLEGYQKKYCADCSPNASRSQKRYCVMCGKELKGRQRQYCSESCEFFQVNVLSPEDVDRPLEEKPSNHPRIAELCRMAREQGLSYGELMAKK